MDPCRQDATRGSWPRYTRNKKLWILADNEAPRGIFLVLEQETSSDFVVCSRHEGHWCFTQETHPRHDPSLGLANVKVLT